MEHMAGGDLQQLFERRRYKPLSVHIVRHITRQIGMALKYMHKHSIIHRDVKLENVMINVNKHEPSQIEAKLIDFGLAEKLKPGKSIIKPKAGTMGYVAPEILAEQPYGTSSDVWSLGCLIYAMLTLTLPSSSQEVAKHFVAHMKAKQGGASGASAGSSHLAQVGDHTASQKISFDFDGVKEATGGDRDCIDLLRQML